MVDQMSEYEPIYPLLPRDTREPKRSAAMISVTVRERERITRLAAAEGKSNSQFLRELVNEGWRARERARKDRGICAEEKWGG